MLKLMLFAVTLSCLLPLSSRAADKAVVQDVLVPASDENCQTSKIIARFERKLRKVDPEAAVLRGAGRGMQNEKYQIMKEFEAKAYEVAEAKLFETYKWEPIKTISNEIDKSKASFDREMREGSAYIKKVEIKGDVICALELWNNGWRIDGSIPYPDLYVKATCERPPLKQTTDIFRYKCDVQTLNDEFWPEVVKELDARKK